MTDNPPIEPSPVGQSAWLKLIRRTMPTLGGEMQTLIEKDGVRGVTSNPAIFEEAVNRSFGHDDEIRAPGRQGSDTTEIHESLAIADAKAARKKYVIVIATERGKNLAAKGARPQRLLWGSTGTKNPKHKDTTHVDPLIGPDTANTMPMETVHACRDHGNPAARITEGQAGALRRHVQLEVTGVDLAAATKRLEDEGVKDFIQPFDKRLASRETKRKAVLAGANA